MNFETLNLNLWFLLNQRDEFDDLKRGQEENCFWILKCAYMYFIFSIISSNQMTKVYLEQCFLIHALEQIF